MKKPYDSGFNYIMLYKLITKIKACINLADIGATDELRAIFRTLIELFMTYASLWDQDETITNSYYEFSNASFNFNSGHSIPDHMKIKANDMKVNNRQFVNYGWIKNLKEFNLLENKTKLFSLGGLAKILDIKYSYFNKTFGSDLYSIYRACNPQTHGTFLLMNYFELELHIFKNIATILKLIAEIMSRHLFDFNFKIGNIDLIDSLNTALEDSLKVYKWLSTNEKNLNKTNLDYKNRAICSSKMKFN